MSYSIITHDGKAHLDELLSCALLSLYKGEPPQGIERVPSQDAAERVDRGTLPPDTFVLDCGMRFDPDKNLFDHHQDKESDSTALLVLNHFFPGQEGTELHDYVTLVSRVDNNGPKSLNDFDLLKESRFYFTVGLKLILKAFESDPLGVTAHFALSLRDNMDFEAEKARAREWMKMEENVSLENREGLTILRFNRRPPSELITPLRAVDDEIVDANGVHVIYSYDDRDKETRTLFRTFHGHDLADFTQCRPSRLSFCHQSGFLMKFIPKDEKEWLSLLRESRTDHV